MEQVDLFIEGHRPNERVGARVGVGVPARARLARVHGDQDCGECGHAACDVQKAMGRAGEAHRRLPGGPHDSAAGLHVGAHPATT